MTENYIYRLSGIIFFMFLYACTDQNTTSNPSHPGPPPPNIVFFIADDWSYPHAGVYGDQTVRTPPFDFLAKKGAQRQNFDLDEEINNYSMLLNNGSAFKKSGCYRPNAE